MPRQMTHHRMAWLVAGVIVGLGISYFWPHEPVQAVGSDSNPKFAMTTVPVSIVNDIEGIFVLDFLTGRLTGGVLNTQNGRFFNAYQRNVAGDFQVDTEAKYVMVAGQANLPNQGQVPRASGVLYIGELTSGRVICYSFPFAQGNRPSQAPLQPVDGFQFRERAN